ncbi:M48 family metallopeptidase [Alicyclobacillus fructus]|uniref:M48 family metallopeptidase n=1 Tax=Alicyclobacillus fructus TaxID=2816082 RepID=UPI001F1F9110|nr:SprT family zinc-dependent metalloprotease [Alicyclobacillus fructus]
MKLTTVRSPQGDLLAYEVAWEDDVVRIRVRPGRRTQKRIVLRADERGYSISAPPWARSQDLENVILQNEHWLRAVHAKSVMERFERLQSGKHVLVLGQRYVIAVGPRGEDGIDHARRTIWIPAGVRDVHTHVYHRMRSFADSHLLQRTAKWAQRTGLHPDRVSIRDQKSRWGSCTSKRHVYLNWRLIQAPQEVMDYVIVHELAHLLHMNHGPAFWQCVAQWMPEWQAQRDWLRLHGRDLFRLRLDSETQG